MWRQIVRFSTKRFTKDHEWISVKDSVCTVGITDYAQKALGDVVYIEFPNKGDMLKQKDTLGAVESVKAASDIYAPVSGKVLSINEELEAEPSLINTSPHEKGWIAKLEISDMKQVELLLDEQEYKKHIDAL